jgi:hypothetical protein
VVHHLAIDASEVSTWPAFSLMTQSLRKTRAMCTSVAISASRKRLCWKLPIGLPKASRVLA